MRRKEKACDESVFKRQGFCVVLAKLMMFRFAYDTGVVVLLF
jgi:hypothetical protein